MANKKKTDPFILDEEPVKKKKGKQSTEEDEDEDFPFSHDGDEDDFEYEDLRDNGDLPPLPEDLYNVIGIIEEYALSEAENALWRAYAAVEDSPDLETAKKKIRALIKKLG